jgi:hypothetical protein
VILDPERAAVEIVNEALDALNLALFAGDAEQLARIVHALVMRGYLRGHADADKPTDVTVPEGENVVSIFDSPKR